MTKMSRTYSFSHLGFLSDCTLLRIQVTFTTTRSLKWERLKS